MARSKIPFAERFMRLVCPEPMSGCWLWLGLSNNFEGGDGYARFHQNRILRYAHVISYELHVGPVPEGLELDHLCRVSCCVNPKHLEPVTHQVNCQRAPEIWKAMTARQTSKTHCPSGHEYTPENTRRRGNGRYCKACAVIHESKRDRKEYFAALYRKRKAAKLLKQLN